MALNSFGFGLNVAVFGASGGLGGAFVSALCEAPQIETVFALSRRSLDRSHPKMRPIACDPLEPASMDAAIATLSESAPIHVTIVAIGMLHADGIEPEKTWRKLGAQQMHLSYDANAVAPIMIASKMLDLMPKDRKGAFAALSARVGMIEDNRLGGWASYRMAKAALNMGIRTLSIELRRRAPQSLIVGLHPGTVATELSSPFRENLRAGQLMTPEVSVERMLGVLGGLTPDDSGHIFDYAGHRL